jgi:hypothetical protein
MCLTREQVITSTADGVDMAGTASAIWPLFTRTTCLFRSTKHIHVHYWSTLITQPCHCRAFKYTAVMGAPGSCFSACLMPALVT